MQMGAVGISELPILFKTYPRQTCCRAQTRCPLQMRVRRRDGSHLISTDVVGHQVIRHCRLPQMRQRYGRSPVRINLSRSCHRRGVDSTYGEPQRLQRIASRLSQRLTSILFAPQIWFRPRAAARYTAAVITTAGNVRPLDGVAAAVKTRRTDTVVYHHSCKRARTNKKQCSCRIFDWKKGGL
jgi:extradiol dioxygenase family protein